MTVPVSHFRSGPYAGSGTTGPFPIQFPFLDAEHLEVIKEDTTGQERVLSHGLEFTVIGGGDSEGGNLTLTQPLAVGETLVILRSIPVTQDVHYREGGPFPARTHERSLDKLTMMTQMALERLDRTALFRPTSVANRPTLADPAPGKALVWSEDGHIRNSTDTFEEIVGEARNAQAQAETAQAQAEHAAAGAAQSETDAEQARDLAREWAERTPGQDIPGHPGHFSARHHAESCLSSVSEASAAANAAANAADNAADLVADAEAAAGEALGYRDAAASHAASADQHRQEAASARATAEAAQAASENQLTLAEQARSDAETARDAAQDAAEWGENQANAAATLAQEWAAKTPGAEISGHPGLYSARHYADSVTTRTQEAADYADQARLHAEAAEATVTEASETLTGMEDLISEAEIATSDFLAANGGMHTYEGLLAELLDCRGEQSREPRIGRGWIDTMGRNSLFHPTYDLGMIGHYILGDYYGPDKHGKDPLLQAYGNCFGPARCPASEPLNDADGFGFRLIDAAGAEHLAPAITPDSPAFDGSQCLKHRMVPRLLDGVGEIYLGVPAGTIDRVETWVTLLEPPLPGTIVRIRIHPVKNDEDGQPIPYGYPLAYSETVDTATLNIREGISLPAPSDIFDGSKVIFQLTEPLILDAPQDLAVVLEYTFKEIEDSIFLDHGIDMLLPNLGLSQTPPLAFDLSSKLVHRWTSKTIKLDKPTRFVRVGMLHNHIQNPYLNITAITLSGYFDSADTVFSSNAFNVYEKTVMWGGKKAHYQVCDFNLQSDPDHEPGDQFKISIMNSHSRVLLGMALTYPLAGDGNDPLVDLATAQGDALTAADQAREWAEKEPAQEISGHPGHYSARHHADAAAQAVASCEAEADLAEMAAEEAATSAAEAGTQAGLALGAAHDAANAATAAAADAIAASDSAAAADAAAVAADLAATTAQNAAEQSGGVFLDEWIRQRAGDIVPPRGARCDFLNGSGYESWTFQRGGSASWFDDRGILRLADPDLPRRSFDPARWAPDGLLLEATATNHVLQSGDLSAVPWAGPATTGTDGTLAPDNASPASLVTDSDPGSQGYREQGYAGPTSVRHRASLFLKAGTSHIAALEVIDDSGGQIISVAVDLRSGTVVETERHSEAGLSLDAFTQPIRPYGNDGWWRLMIMTPTTGSTGTPFRLRVIPAWSTSLSPTADPSATGSIYAWGAQAELFTYTSPIATAATAASRARDQFHKDLLPGEELFPNEFTLFVEARAASMSVTLEEAGNSAYRFTFKSSYSGNNQVLGGGQFQPTGTTPAMELYQSLPGLDLFGPRDRSDCLQTFLRHAIAVRVGEPAWAAVGGPAGVASHVYTVPEGVLVPLDSGHSWSRIRLSSGAYRRLFLFPRALELATLEKLVRYD